MANLVLTAHKSEKD